MGRLREGSDVGAPDEQPQGSPRDLHPTSDIRFVIVEVSKLEERVAGLVAALEKLAPTFEKALEKHAADVKERVGEIRADGKENHDKLIEIEKSFSFVKGALWVFGGLFTIALVVIGVVLRAKLGG